jgi:hypothetical protein
MAAYCRISGVEGSVIGGSRLLVSGLYSVQWFYGVLRR